MSVFAAILAEVTFRGIMQTRFQAVLSVWPAIAFVAFINLVAHALHNLLFAMAVWSGGPIEFGELSGGVIAVIVIVGLASLGVTIALAKDLHRARIEALTY